MRIVATVVISVLLAGCASGRPTVEERQSEMEAFYTELSTRPVDQRVTLCEVYADDPDTLWTEYRILKPDTVLDRNDWRAMLDAACEVILA